MLSCRDKFQARLPFSVVSGEKEKEKTEDSSANCETLQKEVEKLTCLLEINTNESSGTFQPI